MVLPAASAYEKNGTVTNVCGEVQKLSRGPKTMGAKSDLEIIGLLAKEMREDLGPAKPEAVFQEIRRSVPGYDVPLPVIETGGAAPTIAGERPHGFPVAPGVDPLRAKHAFHVGHAGTIFEDAQLGDRIARRAISRSAQRADHARRQRSVGNGETGRMNFFIASLIKIVIVFAIFMTTLAYLQWVERKVLAHIQSRTGPLRVGPHGLLQPLADVFKLLTKEDLLPPYVNRFFYLLAPFIAVCLALISISIIPFGPEVSIFGYRTYMQITDVRVGVLFVLAISAVSVYGVALAGWSSNNKYSLLGGLRSSAQMISYELPLTLAIVSPLLLANHLSFRAISDAQAGYYLGFIPRWNIFQMPFPQIFGFFIFMICWICRDQSPALRFAGGGKRTGGWISHRIQQYEIRLLLYVRVRQHGDDHLRRDAAVPGRMASVVSRPLFELGGDGGITPGCSLVLFSCSEAGAKTRSAELCGVWNCVPDSGGAVCNSGASNRTGPGVLVCRESRRCCSSPISGCAARCLASATTSSCISRGHSCSPARCSIYCSPLYSWRCFKERPVVPWIRFSSSFLRLWRWFAHSTSCFRSIPSRARSR